MPRTINPIRAVLLAACAFATIGAPVAGAAATGGASAPGPTVVTSVTGAATPTAVRPTAVKPAVVKPAVVKPAVVKPAVVKPAVVKPASRQAASSSKAPQRRAAAAGLAPVLTGVKCVSLCVSSLAVHAGGLLVVHGRHFVAGATVVVFPRQPQGGRTGLFTGVVLRSTPHGFVVTVPGTARSGHISLRGPSGLRSQTFGPVRVLPPIPIALQSTVAPSGTAFDGNGMWIWYMSKSDGGDVPTIAARAKAAGITTLFIKSSDGSTNYWSQFTQPLVAAFHALGLRVCAWQYIYGTHPAGEAQLGAQAVAAGADCLVIDAESEYAGKYSAAQTYMQTLRAAVGPTYALGLASFPYVELHSSIPYSVFLGPGGAQFNAPQLYWHTIGTTADAAFGHTYHENRIYARAIMPLGETYGGTPPSEMTRFRALASAYGASGLSWWDWQETTPAGWAALDQPLGALPTAPIVVDTSLPIFSQGAKPGDQIVWMQEHLAAAQPTTPTTGIFDVATTIALQAFQTSRGIPPTGTTDVATWAALLTLRPVAVDWTTAARPG